MANTVSICSAGLVLFLYVSGVLLSQSEIPFSMNGVLTRLNGESAFALMGLLGASIVPHNFYIHSYFAGVPLPLSMYFSFLLRSNSPTKQ